jgi:hypothetical protein
MRASMRRIAALTRAIVAISLSAGAVGAQGAALPALPGRVLDIKVGEYFIHARDSMPAGLVTLRVTQTGDVVKPWPGDSARRRADLTYHFHMVWLVRLDSGKTIGDLMEAERTRGRTPWATVLGGAGFADAPDAANVTMLVPPGSYALVCYVGSAREDRSRDHLLKGMVRPLTVVGPPARSRLPAPRLTIVVRDSAVVVPPTLRAGSYLVRIRNEGARQTDFGIGRVKAGYTLAEARAWRPRMMTEPPRHSVGGVVHIAPGGSLLTTVRLVPGDYLVGDRHVVVRR